jgi:hypothetical protein
MAVLKNYIITAVFMPFTHRECNVTNIQWKFCKRVATIKKHLHIRFEVFSGKELCCHLQGYRVMELCPTGCFLPVVYIWAHLLMLLSFPGPPVPQFHCFQGLWFHLAHPGPCLWPWPVILPLYGAPTTPPSPCPKSFHFYYENPVCNETPEYSVITQKYIKLQNVAISTGWITGQEF